ncbi:hypothetical protein MN608_10127 [Microdochium nivale]|nr:hypothetical protein MN608_10127 [Microdochium nivale]
MLAATDGSPVDFFFRGRAIDYATAGGRVALLAEAVLEAPANDYILSGVSKTNRLIVPAGTLLQFGVAHTAHQELPPGSSTLKSGVSLRDVLVLPPTSALTLSQSMPIGPGGITLTQDTVIPEPMLLAGSMAIQGITDLPRPLVLDEVSAVNVVIDGTAQESYTPTSQLCHGTVLPWATLLPKGIKLSRHTVVPGGSILPAGTILHPSTSLPPGTCLYAGLVLPGGTLVPAHLVRRLRNLEKESDTTATPSPAN